MLLFLFDVVHTSKLGHSFLIYNYNIISVSLTAFPVACPTGKPFPASNPGTRNFFRLLLAICNMRLRPFRKFLLTIAVCESVNISISRRNLALEKVNFLNLHVSVTTSSINLPAISRKELRVVQKG